MLAKVRTNVVEHHISGKEYDPSPLHVFCVVEDMLEVLVFAYNIS